MSLDFTPIDQSENLRYAAKLLFQFRVDLGSETGKRRRCEERIVIIHAPSAQRALKGAKQKGRRYEFNYKNSDGNQVFFEFVGILDLIHLGRECEADEVWYDIVERVSPMERREKIVPPEEQLCALRVERQKWKHLDRRRRHLPADVSANEYCNVESRRPRSFFRSTEKSVAPCD